MLPGVAVDAAEAPLIPIFPEPVCVLLPDPIIFPEIAVGEDCRVEQADKINTIEISNGIRNAFMKLVASDERRYRSISDTIGGY